MEHMLIQRCTEAVNIRLETVLCGILEQIFFVFVVLVLELKDSCLHSGYSTA
jgi:hypothetical protein